jgi:GNAT superfamily N-acetyltransferase
VIIEPYAGDRARIRALFELAEDSRAALDAYIDAGRVLVAWNKDEPIGQLQLVSHQRRGVGAALVAAAVELARADGIGALVVATAAADTGNLRFYQRLGFRLRSVERDAFTPQTGYSEPIEIDGIPLRDRVWLDREH